MVRRWLAHNWSWLVLGALAGLASQLAWLGQHGWEQAPLRMAAGLAAGALVLGPLLAWALPPLRRRWGADAARIAWALSGLGTPGGRRAWLVVLLALVLAAGAGAWWWWVRPDQGAEKVRLWFLARTDQTAQGLNTLLYSSLDMTGPARELGYARDWHFPHLEALPGGRQRNFVVRWLGVLSVPEDGRYGLGGRVDDGLMILVDGRLVAADWREGPSREVWGTVALEAGPHALEVRYRQLAGGASLSLAWQPPGRGREPLPARLLKPLKPGAPLAEVDLLRLEYGLLPWPGSTYPPFQGGRFWRLPWYALQ